MVDIAYKHGKPPVITFDQPLFWKASMIVKGSTDVHFKPITLLLGTFHTPMRLLGCIGVLMANTGLTEVHEQIYGENTVQHMLTGKAYSRALRGHLIVDTALNTLAIDGFRSTIENVEQRTRYADDMYQLFLAGSIKPEDLESNCELNNLQEGIGNIRNELGQSSKTANLWLGYQYIVSIIRNIIQADRLGNWELHLQALTVALPIFVASDHFNYTKSLYL